MAAPDSSSADPLAALAELARLWRLEREGTRERFRLEREELPLPERLRRGLALARLEMVDAEPAPGGLTLVWLTAGRGDLDALRLGPGDPVALWRERPSERGTVRATFARRDRTRLAVMVRGDLPEAFVEGGFNLDREAPEDTFDRGDAALAAFRGAAPGSDTGRLRAVLFGAAPATFGPEPTWSPFDEGLNEPQRAAVGRALAAEHVALIHGPPGTGKTRTLVEVIRQVVARGERVLATAASNLAVDDVAERLLAAGVEVVRLGHPARVSPGLEDRLLHAVVRQQEGSQLAREWLSEAHRLKGQLEKRLARGRLDRAERREAWREIDRLFQDARELLDRTRRAVLETIPVVCATAAGADAALLGSQRFDLVVVDEATQAPDPITLVALGRAPRAVLAGDPCQLPPTVVDRRAEAGGLNVTLFERLAAGDAELVRMLEVQHRMHAAIMAYPSRAHYGGRLVAAPAVAAHTLEDLGAREDPLRPGPLILIDTAGKGWDEERAADDPSTRNPGHARRTAAEVRRLIARGVAPSQVSVIAPYDAQVRLLRELLAAERALGLEVRTVDGFQGRENEAVVVDLVRSNDSGEVGFLGDIRRTNVAITRARRFLLLVADTGTIGQHPYYAGLLEAVEQAGGYVSAWSDEAE